MSQDIELIPDLVEDEHDEIVYHEVEKAAVDLSGAIIEEDKNNRIPITILTGYLGSGKSTLLEKIAKNSNKKLAVILNEFGDSIDIEKSLTIKDKDNEIEEWLDLGNGCLCCTVKDNGVAAIERLVAKRKGFDHIILETTGLADPGPITTMFWLDDGLLSNVYIDGVITVLDSVNIERCLNDYDDSHDHDDDDDDDDDHHHHTDNKDNDHSIAHVQIALADVILLNKIDLIDNNKILKIENLIKQINNNVPIYETKFGDISLDKILGLHSYEAKDVNELIKINNIESNVHDHRIGTVTFNFRKLKDMNELIKFEKLLQDILWDETESEVNKMEIHRVKGLIFIGDDNYRVIQGVRKTYDIIEGNQDISEIKLVESRLVIIGKYINNQTINEKFINVMGFPVIQEI